MEFDRIRSVKDESMIRESRAFLLEISSRLARYLSDSLIYSVEGKLPCPCLFFDILKALVHVNS